MKLIFEIFKYNFMYKLFNKKTPLMIATENENVEIVKLLLSTNVIDVNATSILNFIFFI